LPPGRSWQAENEQKARLRYGLELKTMREGHIAVRREQRGWQDNNQHRLIKERVNAQREALGREFNRAAQENTLTRAASHNHLKNNTCSGVADESYFHL